MDFDVQQSAAPEITEDLWYEPKLKVWARMETIRIPSAERERIRNDYRGWRVFNDDELARSGSLALYRIVLSRA